MVNLPSAGRQPQLAPAQPPPHPTAQHGKDTRPLRSSSRIHLVWYVLRAVPGQGTSLRLRPGYHSQGGKEPSGRGRNSAPLPLLLPLPSANSRAHKNNERVQQSKYVLARNYPRRTFSRLVHTGRLQPINLAALLLQYQLLPTRHP